MSLPAQIFSGIGLGGLVGLLVALSTAHVVGSVIAALTALLAGFFGLSNTQVDTSGWRIGSFGFACVIGVIAGLWIRNGGELVPTVVSQIEEWTSAGYPEEQARELVALQRLGIKPTDAELVQQPSINSLFSARSEEHTSELQSLAYLVCRLLLEK